MATLSVMAPKAEVVQKLERYLTRRKYRHIHVNYTSGEIEARRRNSLLRSPDHVRLVVKQSSDLSTTVELTLNPSHEKRTSAIQARELKLRSKILFYI